MDFVVLGSLRANSRVCVASAASERAGGIFPVCPLEQGLPIPGQGRPARNCGEGGTPQLRCTQIETEDFRDFSLTYSTNFKSASVKA